MLVFEGLAIFFRLDVVILPGVFNDGSELVEFIAFSLKGSHDEYSNDPY